MAALSTDHHDDIFVHVCRSVGFAAVTGFYDRSLFARYTGMGCFCHVRDMPCLCGSFRSRNDFSQLTGDFFLSVAGVLIVPFFVHKEINYHMAIAMFNHFEMKGIWNGTYMVTALYAEMTFITFLFPYFTSQNKTMRSLIWAVITSVIIVLTNLISIILVFGPDLTANLQYPQLELIRYIRAAATLENLDPVLIAIWLSSLFIKISLFLYIAIICVTHTFSLKDHKPFSLFMTVIVVGLSLYMVRSKPEFDELYRHGEFTFLLLVDLIPIVYFVVDQIRSSRVKQG